MNNIKPMTITAALAIIGLCLPLVALGADAPGQFWVTLRIDPRIYPNFGEPQKFDPVFNRANLIAI